MVATSSPQGDGEKSGEKSQQSEKPPLPGGATPAPGSTTPATAGKSPGMTAQQKRISMMMAEVCGTPTVSNGEGSETGSVRSSPSTDMTGKDKTPASKDRTASKAGGSAKKEKEKMAAADCETPATSKAPSRELSQQGPPENLDMKKVIKNSRSKSAGPPRAREGTRSARQQKAADAAQQLWYEWTGDNMPSAARQARERRRLGPDAKEAIIQEANVAKLAKQAEKYKDLADKRLAQCEQFWAESPAPRTAENRNRLGEDVEEARARARGRVMNQQVEEILRGQIEELKQQQVDQQKTHNSKLKALEREVEALKQRVKEAEDVAQEHDESKQELHETIGLLQQKALTANEREIEHQRKLRVFTRLEPIFSKLAETFNFDSPDDVVNRLEFLENQSLHSIDQLIKFQEENTELKKKVETLNQEATAARVALQTENDRRQRETDNATAAHAEELQTMQQTLAKIQEKDEKNFRLQSAVADLWTRCTRNSELVRATDKEEGYLLHEPLEMVFALQEILLMHSPTVAGKKHHELQAYANKVWRTHFEADSELKNKTLDIFMALHDLVQRSLRTIEDLKKDSRELRKQIKKAKETEDRAVRKMKRTEVHHQKFLDDRRATIGTLKGPRKEVTSDAEGGGLSSTEEEKEDKDGGGKVEQNGRQHLGPASNRPASAVAAFGRTTVKRSDGNQKPRPFSATAFAPQMETTGKKPPRDTSSIAGVREGDSSKREGLKEQPVASHLSTAPPRPRPFSAYAQVAPKSSTHEAQSSNVDVTKMPKLKVRPQSAVHR